MSLGRIQKTKAISITRVAQVGFGVLASAAVAVAFFGPSTAPVRAEFQPPEPAPLATDTKGGTHREHSLVDSSVRLAQLSNAPKPVAAKVEPTPGTGPKTAAPPTPAGVKDVKYLGLADVGAAQFALVSVTNKQRFVRVGSSIDPEEVTAITPEAITLRGTGGERHIDLQARSNERVTKLRPTIPAATPAQPAIAQATIANPRVEKMMKVNAGPNMGLEKMPEGSEKWHPAYRRRFERALNELRAQGPFPDEQSLIEKTKSLLDSEGVSEEKPGTPEEMKRAEQEAEAMRGMSDEERAKYEKEKEK